MRIRYKDDDRDLFYTEGHLEIDGIEKAGEGDDGPALGPIKGIVSSEHKDADGETIIQKGIDWSYLLSNGKLTYGHPARPHNICGEPLTVTPTTVDGIAATELTGHLFLKNKLGKAAWDTADMLAKSGAKARLGLSIEGEALERDPDDPKIVLRSRVYTVAVDVSPKNHVSLMDVLAASLGPVLDAEGFDSFGAWCEAGMPSFRLVKAAPSERVVETYRDRVLAGVTDEELLTLRMARSMPDLPWSVARSAVADMIADYRQGGLR